MATPPGVPPAAPSPEPGIREWIAAGAGRVAAVVRPLAGSIWSAAAATVRGARYPGERALVYGSITGLASFFLPWMTVFGGVHSGLGLARFTSKVVWLLPVSMILVFVFSWRNLEGRPGARILRSRWCILAGTLWATLAIIAVAVGRMIGPLSTRWGIWLMFLGSALVAGGGILEIGESLARLDEERRESSGVPS